MKTLYIFLSTLLLACGVTLIVWGLVKALKKSEITQEGFSISVEIIAYLYDRAKSGDDEAFQILQRLFNS